MTQETPDKKPDTENEHRTGIKVDEDWKAQVAREKEMLRQKEQQEAATRKERLGGAPLPKPDFNTLVATFATQALVQLGLIEHPASGRTEPDIPGARYAIDVLDLLKEKTRGNLTPEEERQLDSVLYDLKMRFVEVSSGRAGSGPAPERPSR